MTQHDTITLESILSEVKIIKQILTGNGTPQNGMIVRLDRLEVAHRLHKWVLGVMAVAFATAAAEFIFKLL